MWRWADGHHPDASDHQAEVVELYVLGEQHDSAYATQYQIK